MVAIGASAMRRCGQPAEIERDDRFRGSSMRRNSGLVVINNRSQSRVGARAYHEGSFFVTVGPGARPQQALSEVMKPRGYSTTWLSVPGRPGRRRIPAGRRRSKGGAPGGRRASPSLARGAAALSVGVASPADALLLERLDGAAGGARRAAVFWPAGRLVGGSSAINRDDLLRGHARATIDGNARRAANRTRPAWNYEALLPYFRRAEDFEGGESIHHGTGAPSVCRGRATRQRSPMLPARGVKSSAFGVTTISTRYGGWRGLHAPDAAPRPPHEQRTILTNRHGPRPAHRVPGIARAAHRNRAGAGDRRRSRHLRRQQPDPGRPRGEPQRRCGAFTTAIDALRRGARRRACDASGSASSPIGPGCDNLQDHVRVPVAHECAGQRRRRQTALVRVRFAMRGRGRVCSRRTSPTRPRYCGSMARARFRICASLAVGVCCRSIRCGRSISKWWPSIRPATAA